MIGAGQGDSGEVAVGALGDHVDDARRRREAVIERADALQHLDPVLVLERQVDEVDRRQRAVEPVAGAVLDEDAADRDIVVGRAVELRAADAGGVAKRVEHAFDRLRADQLGRDHIDRQRDIDDPRVAEGADLDQFGAEARAVAGDDDLVERRALIGGGILGVSGQSGERAGERRGGNGYAVHDVPLIDTGVLMRMLRKCNPCVQAYPVAFGER